MSQYFQHDNSTDDEGREDYIHQRNAEQVIVRYDIEWYFVLPGSSPDQGLVR